MKTGDARTWAFSLIIVLGERGHPGAVWEIMSYGWLDGVGIFHGRFSG